MCEGKRKGEERMQRRIEERIAAVRLNQCFIQSLDTPKTGYAEEG